MPRSAASDAPPGPLPLGVHRRPLLPTRLPNQHLWPRACCRAGPQSRPRARLRHQSLQVRGGQAATRPGQTDSLEVQCVLGGAGKAGDAGESVCVWGGGGQGGGQNVQPCTRAAHRRSCAGGSASRPRRTRTRTQTCRAGGWPAGPGHAVSGRGRSGPHMSSHALPAAAVLRCGTPGARGPPPFGRRAPHPPGRCRPPQQTWRAAAHRPGAPAPPPARGMPVGREGGGAWMREGWAAWRPAGHAAAGQRRAQWAPQAPAGPSRPHRLQQAPAGPPWWPGRARGRRGGAGAPGGCPRGAGRSAAAPGACRNGAARRGAGDTAASAEAVHAAWCRLRSLCHPAAPPPPPAAAAVQGQRPGATHSSSPSGSLPRAKPSMRATPSTSSPYRARCHTVCRRWGRGAGSPCSQLRQREARGAGHAGEVNGQTELHAQRQHVRDVAAGGAQCA